MIERALISVYNKDRLEVLAEYFKKHNVEVIASSGTKNFLSRFGVNCTEVADYTGVKEFPEGLVKTLHPKIHFGILMNPNKEEHIKAAQANGIKPIQLVVVNLYPFESVAKGNATIEELRKNIDIGGLTMLRAAAKNFSNVFVLVDPSQYEEFVEKVNLADKNALEEYKKALACKAFLYSAKYEAIIAKTLHEKLLNTPVFCEVLANGEILRYGENWHQKGILWKTQTFRILQGKKMSYNNYLDLHYGLLALKDFGKYATIVIKHNSPCGIAQTNNALDSFITAWQCDDLSAFGSVILCNYAVDGTVAEEIKKRFIEVVVAPKFEEDALNILKEKKNLRLIELDANKLKANEEYRKTALGVLYQNIDDEIFLEGFKFEFNPKIGIVTSHKPTASNELFTFTWKCCKHLKSNAIAIGIQQDEKFWMIGSGFGKPNRVDAVKEAIEKALANIKKYGLKENCIENCVLASDSFFPFADSIKLIASHKIKNVIQPGGSIRDKEVIEEADKNNICMVFTGIRHFKH